MLGGKGGGGGEEESRTAMVREGGGHEQLCTNLPMAPVHPNVSAPISCYGDQE